MRRTAYLFAALLASPLAAQEPASLSLDSVDVAIAKGTKSKKCPSLEKDASKFMSPTGFYVIIVGPLNRIECAAAEAKRRYLPFTRDSAAGMPLDQVSMAAMPIKPVYHTGKWHVTQPATQLLLLAGNGKDDATAVHPDSLQVVPVKWENMAGGKLESAGMRAWFTLSKLPAGEFTIVIVNSNEERRTKVEKNERATIR